MAGNGLHDEAGHVGVRENVRLIGQKLIEVRIGQRHEVGQIIRVLEVPINIEWRAETKLPHQ